MTHNEKEFLVEKIRTQYTEKQASELDELRALDKKAKRPANIFAYAFGSIAALIMGGGMSLVMTDIGSYIGIENTLIPGIAIGIAGIIMACINYPIYKGIISSRKAKYKDKIISLSDRIMKE